MLNASIARGKPYFFHATLIATVVGILTVPSAFSTTIINDPFNYADDASLTSVWSRVSGTNTSIFLATDPSNPSNQTIEQTTAAGRLRRVISGGIVPTAGEPVISFSFNLYDTNGGTANGRVFGELRNSGAANGLLAAGIYNSVNVGVLDITRYQARTIDGGGWIQLDAPRSVGWHNFRFEITGNSADLYVDNVLDPHFTDLAAGGVLYDWVNIGSALSGNTIAYFDDVNVAIVSGAQTTVPEPTTMLLLASGLIGLVGYGRKKFFKK